MDSQQNCQSIHSNITHDWSKRFSSIAKRTAPPKISWLMAKALETPGIISLAAGFVDQETLPNGQVGGLLRDMMNDSSSGQAALQYGTTQGDLDFRTQLIERLFKENVLPADAPINASHCIVGSGSQQVLYLAAEALLDEGDIVLLEAPTYFVVLGVFQSRGARTVGIDTDEYGMIPEKLEQALDWLKREGQLPRVKMLYLMTYSTNPLGVTIPEERRRQIHAILSRYSGEASSILLVEDAAYRRLVFDGECPDPMKGQDQYNDRVLYTESFSKSLSPGLRLGFGVGPKALIDKMVDIKGNHDFGTSNFAQQTLKTVMLSGMFDRHIKTLQDVYRRKRDVVLSILEEYFPAETNWIRPAGGFYTWITLPSHIDTGPESEIFNTALEEKVLYVPGCLCFSAERPESQQSSTLRLSFGMIDEEDLREGCKRLAKTLKRFI